MNVIDDPCYPLISVMAVLTAVFLRQVVKQRVPLILGFGAALQFLTSLLVAFLMVLHTAAVVVHRVTERKAAWVQNEPHILLYGVPYDFRIYSLVLLGFLMTVLSIQGLIAANAMIQKDRKRAFADAIRSNALLMTIALPILPLQGFAVMVVIPALTSIAVVELVRRAVEAPTRKGQMISLAVSAE